MDNVHSEKNWLCTFVYVSNFGKYHQLKDSEKLWRNNRVRCQIREALSPSYSMSMLYSKKKVKITRTRSGVSYKLQHDNTIGWWFVYIATPEREVDIDHFKMLGFISGAWHPVFPWRVENWTCMLPLWWIMKRLLNWPSQIWHQNLCFCVIFFDSTL